jgi:inorganic pyrophosphatase
VRTGPLAVGRINLNKNSMKAFVETVAGSSTRTRYDEDTLKFKESFAVQYKYPYPYGFIMNSKGNNLDCIDCYFINNQKLKAGEIIECEPVGMIEMIEENEIDHKVLMEVQNGTMYDLNVIYPNIKGFIEHVFEKFDDVVIHIGKLVPKDDAIRFISSVID